MKKRKEKSKLNLISDAKKTIFLLKKSSILQLLDKVKQKKGQVAEK